MAVTNRGVKKAVSPLPPIQGAQSALMESMTSSTTPPKATPTPLPVKPPKPLVGPKLAPSQPAKSNKATSTTVPGARINREVKVADMPLPKLPATPTSPYDPKMLGGQPAPKISPPKLTALASPVAPPSQLPAFGAKSPLGGPQTAPSNVLSPQAWRQHVKSQYGGSPVPAGQERPASLPNGFTPAAEFDDPYAKFKDAIPQTNVMGYNGNRADLGDPGVRAHWEGAVQDAQNRGKPVDPNAVAGDYISSLAGKQRDETEVRNMGGEGFEGWMNRNRGLVRQNSRGQWGRVPNADRLGSGPGDAGTALRESLAHIPVAIAAGATAVPRRLMEYGGLLDAQKSSPFATSMRGLMKLPNYLTGSDWGHDWAPGADMNMGYQESPELHDALRGGEAVKRTTPSFFGSGDYDPYSDSVVPSQMGTASDEALMAFANPNNGMSNLERFGAGMAGNLMKRAPEAYGSIMGAKGVGKLTGLGSVGSQLGNAAGIGALTGLDPMDTKPALDRLRSGASNAAQTYFAPFTSSPAFAAATTGMNQSGAQDKVNSVGNAIRDRWGKDDAWWPQRMAANAGASIVEGTPAAVLASLAGSPISALRGALTNRAAARAAAGGVAKGEAAGVAGGVAGNEAATVANTPWTTTGSQSTTMPGNVWRRGGMEGSAGGGRAAAGEAQGAAAGLADDVVHPAVARIRAGGPLDVPGANVTAAEAQSIVDKMTAEMRADAAAGEAGVAGGTAGGLADDVVKPAVENSDYWNQSLDDMVGENKLWWAAENTTGPAAGRAAGTAPVNPGSALQNAAAGEAGGVAGGLGMGGSTASTAAKPSFLADLAKDPGAIGTAAKDIGRNTAINTGLMGADGGAAAAIDTYKRPVPITPEEVAQAQQARRDRQAPVMDQKADMAADMLANRVRLNDEKGLPNSPELLAEAQQAQSAKAERATKRETAQLVTDSQSKDPAVAAQAKAALDAKSKATLAGIPGGDAAAQLAQNEPEKAKALVDQQAAAVKEQANTPEGQKEAEAVKTTGDLTPEGDAAVKDKLAEEGFSMENMGEWYGNLSGTEKFALWSGVGVTVLGLMHALNGGGTMGMLGALMGLGTVGLTLGQSGVFGDTAKGYSEAITKPIADTSNSWLSSAAAKLMQSPTALKFMAPKFDWISDEAATSLQNTMRQSEDPKMKEHVANLNSASGWLGSMFGGQGKAINGLTEMGFTPEGAERFMKLWQAQGGSGTVQ